MGCARIESKVNKHVVNPPAEMSGDFEYYSLTMLIRYRTINMQNVYIVDKGELLCVGKTEK